MFIFRDKVLEEHNQNCLGIYELCHSKQAHFVVLYRYSNNFLSLAKEKGPVPLKVGLIVVEVDWCPCTVQSLYSL